MSKNKAQTPKGTRDFLPLEMNRRNFIFDNIKAVFHLSGYQAIETPAMENLDTLTGKYGEEGDRLIYKILNSGDFMLAVRDRNDLRDLLENTGKLSFDICEKGLRYDLTVPFARFVVAHQHQINFPFKRYQMQNVWRADRPQKGRYREFMQCDADVIGSNSLLNEVELMRIIHQVFDRLKIPVTLKINNRKILAALAEVSGIADRFTEFTVAIDKIEKTGIDKVLAELAEKGFPDLALNTIKALFMYADQPNEEKLAFISGFISRTDTGVAGLKEMREIMSYASSFDPIIDFEIDLSLARGLSYYTGTIIEVKAKGVDMGSICGGGRYDDLTGIFGVPGLSGVGISFGADRIYDVMEELKLFSVQSEESIKVMIVNFGDEELKFSLPLLAKLHEAYIPAEIYPDQAKIKKQMSYANARNIPYVLMPGKDEIAKGVFSAKNMVSGEQKEMTAEEFIEMLK